MIEVRNLFKRYGAFEALKGIDFEVAAGESVGLLGENGAGKTTTMRILAGFIPPTSGTVKLAGHEIVFESKAVRRNIGYLPESVPLYGGMRVQEFLDYRARLKGLRGREVKPAVERALGLVDLVARRRSLIETLSKGLRQRVGLADALVHSPPVLILDEPTSGLDPSQRRDVRDLIQGLKGKHTVLVSSHILPEIETTCDRAVVIHGGNVVARASIEELKRGGDRDRFEILVAGPLEALNRALVGQTDLRSLGAAVAEGEHWRLRLETGDLVRGRALLVARLVAEGLDLIELGSSAGGLESAFLQLIGRDQEAGS
ncbi:MAG: ABC transporter ATP-binding protein [Planctomycetes bacterium]|nr:ABC transporter ATP-binding protein [Planctomycetota bacterium]